MTAMSPDHLSKLEFHYFESPLMPSGEQQCFSLLGSPNFAVYMQTKAQFFWVFLRASSGSAKVFKACLMFADNDVEEEERTV